MVEKDRIITVRNRNNGGKVGYAIPEMGNLVREFNLNEVKKVTFEELEQLTYQRGGRELLRDYLVVQDKEAAEELLGMELEPEYFYTEAQIVELLERGSEEQLIDCINFGGEGVAESVRDIAVKIKLNDIRKRKILSDMTGYNINNAITILEETEDERHEEKAKTRLAATPAFKEQAEPKKERLASTPKYKFLDE